MTSDMLSGRSFIWLLNCQLVTIHLSSGFQKDHSTLVQDLATVDPRGLRGFLDQLCRTFEDVAKEAVTWPIYANDEVCSACGSLFVFSDMQFDQATGAWEDVEG